jgi:hypothetical protein
MSGEWTGFIRRSADGISGELRDEWGWVVRLRGTRQPDGSYALTGTLGDPPAALRIGAIDGPPPEEAP